jgi:hypothetical protein
MEKNTQNKYLSGRKIILGLLILSFMAAGCQKVVLKQEVPSSPRESYNQLPK